VVIEWELVEAEVEVEAMVVALEWDLVVIAYAQIVGIVSHMN